MSVDLRAEVSRLLRLDNGGRARVPLVFAAPNVWRRRREDLLRA